MPDPELIILLLILFGPAIVRALGGGKKKGPTGTELPPVETRRPRPARSSREGARASGERVGAAEAPAPFQQTGPTGAAGDDVPWWDVPEGPAGAEEAETPWWEAPETAGAEPASESTDPWRDDPHRPQGPVVRSPEELWEILTGQRSPFPEPEARPVPAPEPEPVAWGGGDPRAPRPEPAGDDDVISLEGDSLEAIEISSEARHEEFHREIDRVAPRPRRMRALDRLGLEDRGDVRRAVVLAEVLGKPRSLSGPDW